MKTLLFYCSRVVSLAFLAALTSTVTAQSASVSLVAPGSVWKYLDNGTDQGTAWRAPAFDDSSWVFGPAQLGYGDGDEATVVNSGPGPSIKFVTTYFRRAFVVTGASDFSNVVVRVLRDDGAVVYLNGVEIFRSNMPPGPINFQTFAVTAVGGADEMTFYSSAVDPTLLANGVNVFAVEIHQSSLSSSDLSFDLELTANGPPQPERTIVTVEAIDSQARESGPLAFYDGGQFAIRRSGNLGFSVPVTFTLSGTASNGVDYSFISNQVVIPAGATQMLVNVSPITDALAEGTESVVLTLEGVVCAAVFPLPPECYIVGTPGQATVFIADWPMATNHAPTASLVSPSDGAGFTAPADITLVAHAQDAEGDSSVQTVEFFAGATSLGIRTNYPVLNPLGPFVVSWPNVPAGAYTLFAVATDDHGARGTSAPVHITVTGATTNSGPEFHAIGIYSGTATNGGTSSNHERGQASVVINRPGQHVTLFLSANEPVLWHITVNGGTVLERIILGGYYRQALDGVPANVEVINAFFDDGRGTSQYLDIGYTIDSVQFHRTRSRLCTLFGMDLASFQGGYQAPYPTPFVIDQVQNDPRLRCDYPQPVSSSDLPDLSFQLAFYNRQGGTNVFFQNYTLAGPVDGTKLLPALRVVTDAGGRYFYGEESHAMWRIDSLTGTNEQMDLGNAVPELSWPTGVAFDSQRNRVLLVSLGGEGFLYAYSPPQLQWSLVSSMNNRDVNGLVYHPGYDTIYAVKHTYDDSYGSPAIYRFNAAGAYLGQIPLPVMPFNFGPVGYKTELVSVGDYLVLLIEPNYQFLYGTEPRESRIYLIDPRNGQVSLTYRRVETPENQKPIARILSPAEGALLPLGTNRITVEAIDPDGFIASVEFFANGASLGLGQRSSVSNNIFTLDWIDQERDWFTLTARATDTQGASVTSAAVRVAVGTNVPDPEIPHLTFRLAFNTPQEGGHVFVRNYTLTGAVEGLRLLPAARVVADASDRYYYGADSWFDIWRADAQTEHVEPMVLPPELPELSWAMGAAFDHTRNRILVVSLGGEGFLYGYSPATQQWSLVSSMNNHDLDSIVYHAASDSLYAFAPHYGGPPGLEEFNSDGSFVRSLSLPALPFTVGPGQYVSELVSLGEYLVLLLEPNPLQYYSGGTRESRIYLVDPRNGEVRLTYQRAFLDADGDGVPDENDLCPNTPPGALVDEHGCTAIRSDSDGDGVIDSADRCPNTMPGVAVNEYGCSIAQLCPCAGPWRTHTQYVDCVSTTARGFWADEIITGEERDDIVSEAQRSDCGRRPPRLLMAPQGADELRTNGCRLALEGDGPATCIVECSADLIQWTPIRTNTLSGVTIEIMDTDASTAPRRFYRLRPE